jgi:hypothetical protein
MIRPMNSEDCSTASARAGPKDYVADMTNFHDLEMTSITGEQVSFDQYKGNLALVVNVASA